MLVLQLRFPGGRFHATPWGRNVNEGVPEWPPSPFRLVRALYDVWKRKAPELPTKGVEQLLGLLASTAPDFSLPRATASHTRAYLRQGTHVESDKDLVFDPFVVLIPDAPIRLRWPSVVLDSTARELLAALLSRLGYLGRAESLVDARLADDEPDATWDCRPIDRADPGSSDDDEIVQVACVAPPGAHLALEWRAPGDKKKRPLTWFEALTWGSRETLGERLSDPPALRWVAYRRRRDALDPEPTPRRPVGAPAVTTMLFALSGTVLPRAADTVMIAERFRRLAMGASRRVGGGDPSCVSPLLAGKDPAGVPLEGHPHAYYLPLDRDRDGRIDHVLVRCAGGLSEDDQVALGLVESLWQSKGRPDVKVVLVSRGAANLLPASRVWVSATPFVTSRHHRKQLGPLDAWLDTELRRSLRQSGLPEPIRVTPLAERGLAPSARKLRWFEFRRARQDESPRSGYGFVVEFADEVRGPFAVGYAAHYGLGQFDPRPTTE